jgi:nucleotide-binding universal stress UspA family protein
VFDRILVPLDGSEHSHRALETAIQIAKKFDSKVALLHVYSITVMPVIVPEPTTVTPAGVPVATSAEVSRMVDAARDAGKEILTDGEQKSPGSKN